MSHARAFTALGIAGIIIGALVYFAPTIIPYIQNPISHNSPINAQFGTEIKNYPLDNLSFTVTSWWFATKEEMLPNLAGISGFLFNPPSGSVYVVVNFTLQNTGDTDIDLGTLQNFWKLSDVTFPLLKYGNYYAGATPTSFDTYPFYGDQPKDLMPNQTRNGAFVYQILEGYSPSKLLYPNKDSPTFVINFSG